VKARTKVGAKADRNGKGVKGAEGEEATKGTGAAKGSASSSKAGLIGVSSGRTVKSNRAENVSMPEATDRVADGGTAGPVNSKQKLVRDSFTMPRPDFALIDMLKERMVAYRRPTKKSDLLRAGLHTLMALPDVKVREVLDGLAPLKAGRPRKNS
jgi:hypothetical protein